MDEGEGGVGGKGGVGSGERNGWVREVCVEKVEGGAG